jgi:hypothetical protein
MGDEEWIDAQVAAGQQEIMARLMLDVYHAAHLGFFAGTDLGRWGDGCLPEVVEPEPFLTP